MGISDLSSEEKLNRKGAEDQAAWAEQEASLREQIRDLVATFDVLRAQQVELVKDIAAEMPASTKCAKKTEDMPCAEKQEDLSSSTFFQVGAMMLSASPGAMTTPSSMLSIQGCDQIKDFVTEVRKEFAERHNLMEAQSLKKEKEMRTKIQECSEKSDRLYIQLRTFLTGLAGIVQENDGGTIDDVDRILEEFRIAAEEEQQGAGYRGKKFSGLCRQ